MTWFFISVVIFLAGHIIPGLMRKQLVERFGHRTYVIGFSVLSTVLLVWVIYEVLNAESVWFWDFAPWQAQLTVTVMLPACILWAAAILQPCPLSIGRKNGFDPARPGINAFCRHPLLLGAFLWGVGHVVVNGDLVALLFFGGSALFAVIGFWRMEKIRLREFSDAQKAALLGGTRRFSPSGLFKGAIGWRDIALGIAIYAVLLFGHEHVIGVSPLLSAGW